jgi:hypothetical protein
MRNIEESMWKAIVVLLLSAASVSAQQAPRREMAVGYSVSSSPDGDDWEAPEVGTPFAWFGDFTEYLSRHVGVTGRIGFRDAHRQLPSRGYDSHVNNVLYSGGVRIVACCQVVRPFGQVLIGGMRTSWEDTRDSTTGTSISFTTQFGGGADVALGERVRIRASVNFLRTVEALDFTHPKMHVEEFGVVFGFR